jgi:CRP-like cAMP-binding protein
MAAHILVEMMAQLTPLSEEEAQAIDSSFPIKTYEKGTYLLKEGEVAHSGYFIVQGCVREYKMVAGEDKTTAFYTEHESAINFDSLTNQTPSHLNFECLEDTTVAIVNAEKENALYKRFPRFETFCRAGVEQMMGAQQAQLTTFITLKPEQRYQKLQRERPDLINRVPQFLIASYLGIKPESLSRIRSRLLIRQQ